MERNDLKATAEEILGDTFPPFIRGRRTDGRPKEILEEALSAARAEERRRIRKDRLPFFWANVVVTQLRSQRKFAGFQVTRDMNQAQQRGGCQTRSCWNSA